MTKDLDKGVSNNLGSATNNYVYGADGSKLRVTKGSFQTDYVGNVVYENNEVIRNTFTDIANNESYRLSS